MNFSKSHSLTRTVHRSKTKYTKYLSNNSFDNGKKNNEFGLQVGLLNTRSRTVSNYQVDRLSISLTWAYIYIISVCYRIIKKLRTSKQILSVDVGLSTNIIVLSD